jgi:hypothetical protein
VVRGNENSEVSEALEVVTLQTFQAHHPPVIITFYEALIHTGSKILKKS